MTPSASQSLPADPAAPSSTSSNTVSRRRQFVVLGALFAAWSVAYTDRIVIGTAIIPISHELGLSDAAKGYVLGAFYATYALMQLGGGWLADRLGARRVLVGCLALWSLFTAFTGAAWSLASLLAFRLLFGVGEGSFAPASSSAIVQTFPLRVRARVQALMCSTVFLGGAVGAAVVGWTISRFGWRQTFVLLGLLGACVAVVLLVVPGRRAATQDAAAGEEADTPEPHVRWREIARTPLVWRVALTWFGACVLALGLQAWLPTWIMRTRGIDVVHIGLISAVPLLASFIGTNFAGHFIDRSPLTRLRWLLAGGALASAGFAALMPFVASLSALIACWTLCMLAFDLVYASVFAIPLKCFPASTAGRTTGLINFAGQLAGAISPVVVGRLVGGAQGSGWLGAFAFLTGGALLAFVIALGCNFRARGGAPGAA
ncbi:MFS transporter [Paraburkholderia flagellata]|uniref:MFS transporter n=1 Tax=Paraburkholderia flagellata TaxID=2883241 RepID=UPI001F26D5E4|nr:MFS transporter [Paraburkholderia flagellata]